MHGIKQLALSRKLWIVVLSCWLTMGFVSIAHSQQHVLASDMECHLCFTSFHHTPFIASDSLTPLPVIQSYFVIVHKQTVCFSKQPLTISNRGPPL